ncbi:neuromedin-U receptor 2-like [Ptychodera flava]|uniref:neuromedin-U receptor 2-like n=1 Tax=Ptychodera flava TaxID=63121 RepID=UPI00396AAB67
MNNSIASALLKKYNYEWNDTYGSNDSSEGDNYYERQGYNFVAYSLVLTVILILGLFGNCTFMYVTWKVPSMRTVLNIYLMNLCVADTVFLVTGIPIQICLNHEVISIYNDIVFISTTFCFIPQAAGLFTVTLISIERYVGICHPFKARYFHNKYRIWVSVISSWLFGFLPSLLYVVGKKMEFKDMTVITVALLCDILSFVVCLCIVFFLYSMIICRMRKDENTLANTSTAMIQERKQVVVLLVVTTSIFFVCLFPTYMFQFDRLLYEMAETFIWAFWPETFSMLAGMLLYFNSAINPVIYNITSAKYREAFKKAFDEWKC